MLEQMTKTAERMIKNWPAMRRRVDGWDVAADVVLDHIQSYRGESSVWESEIPYYPRVAKQHLVKISRNAEFRRTKGDVTFEIPCEKSTGADFVINRDTQSECVRHIQHALSQLSDIERRAIVLWAIENASYEDIGRTLRRTEKAVDGLLRRAKCKLRRWLKPFFPELAKSFERRMKRAPK